eukprot:UN22580
MVKIHMTNQQIGENGFGIRCEEFHQCESVYFDHNMSQCDLCNDDIYKYGKKGYHYCGKCDWICCMDCADSVVSDAIHTAIADNVCQSINEPFCFPATQLRADPKSIFNEPNIQKHELNDSLNYEDITETKGRDYEYINTNFSNELIDGAKQLANDIDKKIISNAFENISRSEDFITWKQKISDESFLEVPDLNESPQIVEPVIPNEVVNFTNISDVVSEKESDDEISFTEQEVLDFNRIIKENHFGSNDV